MSIVTESPMTSSRSIHRTRSRRRRELLPVVAAISLLLALIACGKSLASQVDELLKAGRTAEAKQKLAQGLPDLVASKKLGEVEEVASVLRQRTATLPPAEAKSVRESGATHYFEGINEGLSNLPLDDVCEAALTSRVPPSLADSATTAEYLSKLEGWAAEEQRRQSLGCRAKR